MIRKEKRRVLVIAAASTGLVVSLIGAGVAQASKPEAAAAPDIDVAKVQNDLKELESIAEKNGGNRHTGEPGFKASLAFIKKKLDAAGFETKVQDFDGGGQNLVADWPKGGSAKDTVMVGSHLDSVSDGPGINDNGTGSAGVLETALAVAEEKLEPAKHLRFAWWGGEEEGLLGSQAYVQSLSDDQVKSISTYLNFDMIGSPNAGHFVYQDDEAVAKVLKDYFKSKNVTTGVSEEVNGRSDHASFSEAGITVGGTFTGAGEVMTEEQAKEWGGKAGEPYDSCYHSKCDDFSNVNEKALNLHSDAMAHAVWELSS